MQLVQYNDDVDSDDNRNNSQGKSDIKRRTWVGPWKNVEEFHKVYDWLFAESSTEETRARAAEQMRVWSLRRGSLCPAAVLATIVLLEVQQKDTKIAADDSISRLTQDELQSLYANAFTRFFNYMSSIMQTHNMRTMYETAQQLGLPTFVVDLRHLCAHGQALPPLEVLRSTSQLCYVWLHDYYWSSHRDSMSNVDASKIRRKDKTEFDDNVSYLFRLYDLALEGCCKGAHNLKTVKRHLHGKRLMQLKEFMNQKQVALLKDTLNMIVKECNVLIKREVGLKDLTEIFIEALLKMSYFFEVAEKHANSSQELQSVVQLTQSLFRLLATQGLIDELFLQLIVIAEDDAQPTKRRVGASFWAMQIANGFVAFRKCKQLHKLRLEEDLKSKECDFSTFNSENISNQAKKLLKIAGVDMKTTLIFGSSMRKPWMWVFERRFLTQRLEKINSYTAPVIKSLLALADPSLTTFQIKALKDLIDLQFEQNTDQTSVLIEKPMETNEKVYTAEDLLEKLKDNDMDIDVGDNEEFSTDNIKKYGIWSTLPADETQQWSICPLGRLPWE